MPNEPYIIMKEGGAGNVRPGHFYPTLHPDITTRDPTTKPDNFIYGLLSKNVGTQWSNEINAAGAWAFCTTVSGDKICFSPDGSKQDYTAWINQQPTAIQTLFEKAWEARISGFFWIPIIHPRCLLYVKGHPRRFRAVKKDGKTRLCLLVQRAAGMAIAEAATGIGLTVSGTITPGAWYNITRQALDALISPQATNFASDGAGGIITTESTEWHNSPTFTVNLGSDGTGTDAECLPLGFGTNSSVSTHDFNAAQISTLASAAKSATDWPDTITTIPTIVTADPGEDIEAWAKGRNMPFDMAGSMVDAFAPDMAEAGPWRIGTYTSGDSVMLTSGPSANEVGNASAGFPAVNYEDSTGYQYPAIAKAVSHYGKIWASTDDGTQGTPAQLGTATVDGIEGYTIADAPRTTQESTYCPNIAIQRIAGFYEYADISRGTLTINLYTGFAGFYVENVYIGIRTQNAEGGSSIEFYSGTNGVYNDSYDSTNGILWLRINTEEAGLETESNTDPDTSGQYPTRFVYNQSIAIEISVNFGSNTPYKKLMLSTGRYQGGGSIGGDPGPASPPKFLTSWDKFTPAATT